MYYLVLPVRKMNLRVIGMLSCVELAEKVVAMSKADASADVDQLLHDRGERQLAADSY